MPIFLTGPDWCMTDLTVCSYPNLPPLNEGPQLDPSKAKCPWAAKEARKDDYQAWKCISLRSLHSLPISSLLWWNIFSKVSRIIKTSIWPLLTFQPGYQESLSAASINYIWPPSSQTGRLLHHWQGRQGKAVFPAVAVNDVHCAHSH